MSILFSPVRVGRIDLSNRLVMAPMTRSRSDDKTGVPSDLVAKYYEQRAGAGMIISEGVFPTASGKGYVRTPGIESAEQIAAWTEVAKAVHARGGRIFMQLMHSGRISHPSLQPDNALPVAPSAIRPAGQTWTATGLQDFVTPHQLTEQEIADVVASYGTAARNAIEAGFDGVELHGASGYLPEQFLSSGSNHRIDEYGGSIQNRSRFALNALESMIAQVGADRVGLKISPEMNFNDVSDETPQDTYTYLVKEVAKLNLAYLHVALFGTPVDYHAMLKPLFNGTYLMGGGLNQQSAQEALENGRADAVVFGGAFLANPDLPERFMQGAELNTPDKATFYSEGAQGYTDYPTLASVRGVK
jgi:N-ethylmaleimide reductase